MFNDNFERSISIDIFSITIRFTETITPVIFSKQILGESFHWPLIYFFFVCKNAKKVMFFLNVNNDYHSMLRFQFRRQPGYFSIYSFKIGGTASCPKHLF